MLLLAAHLSTFGNFSILSFPALAQSNATLRGTVTLSDSGKPIHNVLVTILHLKRTVDTDDNDKYEFQTSTRQI
jgi:hypothetical protein